MPFVRIDALRADPAKLDGLGRAVHEALVDAIGIPADDLFQVLTSHDGATGTFRFDPDYLGVHRDDGVVYVDITMRAGRTDEQKKALYARIAELAGKYADTEPRTGAHWQPGPPGRILGDARVSLFDIPREETDLTAMTVDLRDGARATWHSHPCGQILVAISGYGQVQAEGGEIVELEPGDSIWAPPGERHWHGAMPGHDFTYASIQPIDPTTGNHVDWSSASGR
jgi:quercetin dioxygenase-like cupin family protein/phenylpyruvate tautomerase PptA (4-oxalocrotonate tautomerase family)